MEKLSTKDQLINVQVVRVLDMVFVAPVLIYAGAIPSSLPKALKVTLIGLGVATFFYNANNYLKVIKAENEE